MVIQEKCFGLVAAVIASTILTPSFALASTQPTMQKSTISVNGTTISTQYKFAYNGTTYMPIWYVIQALKRVGVSATWNGTTHRWDIQTNGMSSSLSLNAKSGQTSIYVDNSLVENNIPTLVSTDPASKQATTFMPIWYIQQVLNVIGFSTSTDSWNGNTGVWSLHSSNTSTSTSSLPTQAQIISAGNLYVNSISDSSVKLPTYSAVSSATQWYNDPSDMFYNKKIPLSDFVNNKVIQQSPFVVMSNQSGAWYEMEYVGKSSVSAYWKVEVAESKTGNITWIDPSIETFSIKLLTPSSGGFSISSNPGNPIWGNGRNLYMVPQPDWNPNY